MFLISYRYRREEEEREVAAKIRYDDAIRDCNESPKVTYKNVTRITRACDLHIFSATAPLCCCILEQSETLRGATCAAISLEEGPSLAPRSACNFVVLPDENAIKESLRFLVVSGSRCN